MSTRSACRRYAAVPRTSSIGLAAAATRSAKRVARRASGAVTSAGDRPGRAEGGAQLAALRSTASASEHDGDHHRVARADLHERLRGAARPHAHRGDQLVRARARSASARRGTRASGSVRVPRARSRARPRAPSTSSGGSASPAGDAVPRLPPIVPRLRICGEPTVREASASAGSSSASSAAIASVYVEPGAEPHGAVLARPAVAARAPRSGSSSASGRARSKFSSTITSVPPSIGRASGRSALQPQRLVEGPRSEHLHRAKRNRSPVRSIAWPPSRRRLAVARGDEPADLVVRGGRCSPSSRASGSRPTSRSSTAASRGSATTRARRRSTRRAAASCPGFVDAHMHLESSKLLADEFARLVLPLGTTAVVADPHEIANVLGTDGVHWLLDFCAGPAARRLLHGARRACRRRRSSRRAARSTTATSRALLRRRRVLGLAEMMNFPASSPATEHELSKLALAARRTSTGTRRACRQGAERLRRGRDPLRPRGAHARGGPRAARARACGC